MRWVTRARPKIDRIACPWLICRFIDPEAEFLFVPPDQVMSVASAQDATPFDVPDVELSHVGELCSFDAFLAKYDLHDPALARLALIVRGADTGRLDIAPQAAGLLAISLGLSQVYADDHAMLAQGLIVYDALYAWCAQGQAETHTWNPGALRAATRSADVQPGKTSAADAPVNPGRRQAMVGMGVAASLPLLPTLAGEPVMSGQHPPIPAAFAGKHDPKPLPFDPGKLKGLSERLIRSHWENNYIGSVKALNMIETRLAAAMKDSELPPLVYGGLKREELHRVGSVILHEHYFGTLGGPGKPGGAIVDALKTAYGSVEAWEAEFRRTALSLAGGSGWCVLTYNTYTGEVRNQWAWDHMHGAIAGLPLIVLDMYEHAFHMDYGTAAAKYVDAWFANLDWERIDQNWHHALRTHAA